MTSPQPAPTLGPRLAEVYSVVGPLYRRAQRTVENAEHIEGASVGVRAVLELLSANGPMTVPDMGRNQALSRQFVQRMVNDAIELGWVRVNLNPAHKRSSLIALTPAGHHTIATIITREHDRLSRVGEGVLTDEDIDTCLRVLRHMLTGLDTID